MPLFPYAGACGRVHVQVLRPPQLFGNAPGSAPPQLRNAAEHYYTLRTRNCDKSLRNRGTEVKNKLGRFLAGAALFHLILLFASLLAAPLASERLFNALLFAWLQVKGVSLDLLDDVFLLHLAFEAPQRVFEGFTLLNANFSQLRYTPKLVPLGPD